MKKEINISVFSYGNKEKHPIYVSKKCCKEKHFDLLLIGKKGKILYVLIKDFNIFMYDYTLHHGKNIFVVIVYKLLVKEKYQNVILKTALNLMANKELSCLKKMNMLHSKSMTKNRRRLSFMEILKVF